MDSENDGQHMEGLQQFWNSPQLQQLYHQFTAQRNLNTHQVGLCPTNAQHIHMPPPATPAYKYPAPQPTPHTQYPDFHNQASSSHGPYNQAQSWQWPSQPQLTTYGLPHAPCPLTPAPEWSYPPTVSYPQSGPQYPPPHDLSPDLRQHFRTQPRCNTPDPDTVRSDREPSTTPDPRPGRAEPHSTQESPAREEHSPRSYNEQHPRTQYEETQEEDVSHSGSISRHGNKRRGKHKRPKDNSSRRRHKKRRKHSSSSYSNHSICEHTQRESTQTLYHGNHKQAPIRRRKRNTHAFAVQKEERWLTLSHAVGKKTSSPPTGAMLCDCIRTVLHKGGFVALPHLRSMSQINISHRPHSSKDRATQWVLQFPPPRGSFRAKSSGSITFYATRWGIATTEGNVMINANSTITRCVRIALVTACKEVTYPVGLNVRATSSLPPTTTMNLGPTNLSEAINQCVGFMDQGQAAAILAMKPNVAAPGEASTTQEFLTNLLQSKSSVPSKRTSTHKR